MAYPQDLEGKYIQYKVDPGGAGGFTSKTPLADRILANRTVAANAPVYTCDAGLKSRQRIKGGFKFVNTNIPWNFTFLKYVAGAVTTAPLAGPVVTGPMSGCYLCRFNQGGLKMSHIGTADLEEESMAVKRAWLGLVAGRDVSNVVGGSPNDYFSPTERQNAMLCFDFDATTIVGYFTPADAYAILLAKVPALMVQSGLSLSHVAAVKKMTLQPWSSIAAMRRFRV